MPSPIYQYVVNLVVSLTIRGGPGVFVNVPVREHRALNQTIIIIIEVIIIILYTAIPILPTLSVFQIDTSFVTGDSNVASDQHPFFKHLK